MTTQTRKRKLEEKVPITRDSENFSRKQVVFTKSLNLRFDKYCKEKCPRQNVSEVVRAIIDEHLRKFGY